MSTTLAISRSGPASERVFFTGLAVAMLAAVVLGFSRSFYLHPLFPERPVPPEGFFTLHGVVLTLWMLMAVLQPSLVAARRIDLHRVSGAVGVALAAAVVIVSLKGAFIAAARPTGFVGIPVPPLQFLVVPFIDMVLFAAFVALAVAWRHDGPAHKRLMSLATCNLVTAAVARWPFDFMPQGGPPLFFALTDLFPLALVVWDFRSRGRLHPATLWGVLALVLSQPLRLLLSGTTGWLDFAGWLVGR